jgi:hypothetical protein
VEETEAMGPVEKEGPPKLAPMPDIDPMRPGDTGATGTERDCPKLKSSENTDPNEDGPERIGPVLETVATGPEDTDPSVDSEP